MMTGILGCSLMIILPHTPKCQEVEVVPVTNSVRNMDQRCPEGTWDGGTLSQRQAGGKVLEAVLSVKLFVMFRHGMKA